MDHILYDYFREGSDDASARQRITAVVSAHVNAVSIIYSTTDFNGILGLRFTVAALRVRHFLTTWICYLVQACVTALDVRFVVKALVPSNMV